ncbi:alcohol dehydrogenase catalytic domain-containing protein [Streptosporangium sp. NPDC049078]|uniref:zinc-dependent alcohol dehydrogenase n=1 Tax=Streptosporangium sp. NPDC049078 TaxID=3155767 RepID=UPI00341FA4A5
MSAGQWPAGTMPALVFTAPGVLSVERVPVPEPAAGEVLVRVAYLGICGTDVHLLDGSSAYVSSGLTHFPIRFGHEWAGEVVAVGPSVPADLVGERVVGEPFLSCGQCLTCRGGHYNLCPDRYELGVRGAVPGAAARYLRIPAANVHVVPAGVESAHALLAEPLVTVLSAFEEAAAQPGEPVAVLGTGTLGLLAVQVAAAMRSPVDVIGIDPEGLKMALRLGARAAWTPQDAPSDAYQVVIEATGSAAIGPVLTRVAGIAGRVLQVGIPGRPVDGVDLAAFVTKGLRLSGVLGGVDLMPRALHLIADGAVSPTALIERVFPVAGAREAFDRMREAGRARPKLVIDLSELQGEEPG